jgi:hypothetical protein
MGGRHFFLEITLNGSSLQEFRKCRGHLGEGFNSATEGVPPYSRRFWNFELIDAQFHAFFTKESDPFH